MRTYYIYDEDFKLIGMSEGREPSDFQYTMYLDMGYLICSELMEE